MSGPNRGSAQAVAAEVSRLFTTGEVDEVYLIFNEFKSALTQTVIVEPLLPLSADKLAGLGGATTETKYEPNREELLGKLLPGLCRAMCFGRFLSRRHRSSVPV